MAKPILEIHHDLLGQILIYADGSVAGLAGTFRVTNHLPELANRCYLYGVLQTDLARIADHGDRTSTAARAAERLLEHFDGVLTNSPTEAGRALMRFLQACEHLNHERPTGEETP